MYENDVIFNINMAVSVNLDLNNRTNLGDSVYYSKLLQSLSSSEISDHYEDVKEEIKIERSSSFDEHSGEALTIPRLSSEYLESLVSHIEQAKEKKRKSGENDLSVSPKLNNFGSKNNGSFKKKTRKSQKRQLFSNETKISEYLWNNASFSTSQPEKEKKKHKKQKNKALDFDNIEIDLRERSYSYERQLSSDTTSTENFISTTSNSDLQKKKHKEKKEMHNNLYIKNDEWNEDIDPVVNYTQKKSREDKTGSHELNEKQNHTNLISKRDVHERQICSGGTSIPENSVSDLQQKKKHDNLDIKNEEYNEGIDNILNCVQDRGNNDRTGSHELNEKQNHINLTSKKDLSSDIHERHIFPDGTSSPENCMSDLKQQKKKNHKRQNEKYDNIDNIQNCIQKRDSKDKISDHEIDEIHQKPDQETENQNQINLTDDLLQKPEQQTENQNNINLTSDCSEKHSFSDGISTPENFTSTPNNSYLQRKQKKKHKQKEMHDALSDRFQEKCRKDATSNHELNELLQKTEQVNENQYHINSTSGKDSSSNYHESQLFSDGISTPENFTSTLNNSDLQEKQKRKRHKKQKETHNGLDIKNEEYNEHTDNTPDCFQKRHSKGLNEMSQKTKQENENQHHISLTSEKDLSSDYHESQLFSDGISTPENFTSTPNNSDLQQKQKKKRHKKQKEMHDGLEIKNEEYDEHTEDVPDHFQKIRHKDATSNHELNELSQKTEQENENQYHINPTSEKDLSGDYHERQLSSDGINTPENFMSAPNNSYLQQKQKKKRHKKQKEMHDGLDIKNGEYNEDTYNVANIVQKRSTEYHASNHAEDEFHQKPGQESEKDNRVSLTSKNNLTMDDIENNIDKSLQVHKKVRRKRQRSDGSIISESLDEMDKVESCKKQKKMEQKSQQETDSDLAVNIENISKSKDIKKQKQKNMIKQGEVAENEKNKMDVSQNSECNGSNEQLEESNVDKTNQNLEKAAVSKEESQNTLDTNFISDADSESDSSGISDLEERLQNSLDEGVSNSSVLKLRHLFIVVDWEIPEAHMLETAITSCPKKPLQKLIRQSGVFIKKGAYSAKEDKIIRKNWQQFSEMYDFPDPRLFFSFTHKGVRTLPLPERIKFAQFLGKGLQDRLLFSIYQRFKMLFGNINKGRFTEAEDRIILKYMNSRLAKDSQKFSKLAKILNRDRVALLKHSEMLLKQQKEKLKWTLLRLEKVLISLMKNAKVTKVKHLKQMEINSSIWKSVSAELNIPVHKIKYIWETKLYPGLFRKEKTIPIDIVLEILDYLYENKVKDWKLIDWSYLANRYPGLTAPWLYKYFKQTARRFGPKNVNNLKEVLIVLKNDKRVHRSGSKPLKRLEFRDGSLFYV